MDSKTNVYENLIGLWGIHPRLIVDVQGKVHPNDVDKVREWHSSRLVYYVEEVEAEYLHLRYQREVFRVRPQGFEIVKSPACFFGDSIVIRRTTGKLNEAVIKGIIWHAKRGVHYYRVEIFGRMISRWVFEEDVLIRLE